MRKLALHLLLALASLGCTNLDDFDGEYGGSIVGTDDSSCSGGSCSFIRRGFEAGTQMSLRFDAQGPDEMRRLTTTDGTFTDTLLRPITPVEHDFLSQLELPGAGRIKTFIYSAKPTDGPLAARDPIVFLSLMDGDQVEVRILVGRGDFFGFFRLNRS